MKHCLGFQTRIDKNNKIFAESLHLRVYEEKNKRNVGKYFSRKIFDLKMLSDDLVNKKCDGKN